MILMTWIKASPQRDLGGGINMSEGRSGEKGNREQQIAGTARRAHRLGRSLWICRKGLQERGNQAQGGREG